jgi:CutC family
MVRPRAGDFFYSNEEIDVILEDIGYFKSIGIAGVVFGVLNPDGTVDVPNTRMCVIILYFHISLKDSDRLVEAALPMQGLLRFQKRHTDQSPEVS